MFDKVLNTFLDYFTETRHFFSKTSIFTLHKVWSVLLRISSYLRNKSLVKNFFFVQCWLLFSAGSHLNFLWAIEVSLRVFYDLYFSIQFAILFLCENLRVRKPIFWQILRSVGCCVYKHSNKTRPLNKFGHISRR